MIPGQGSAHIVNIGGGASLIENTMEAAALCACGVPIRTFQTPREKTGQTEWRFDYTPSHPTSIPATPGALIRIGEMDYSAATLTANQIMHAYRSGALESGDPLHPYLDAMRALRNRERFLRWVINGQPCALVKHPVCDRWQYESAPLVELPAHMVGDIDSTHELKVVCTIGIFGVPNVRVSGIFPDNTFEIAKTGFPGESTPPQTTQLACDALDGSLDAREPHHPWFIAYAALEWMQQLKRHMKYEIASVWLEKPKSKLRRSAFLRADATSKARDKVFDHFRKGE